MHTMKAYWEVELQLYSFFTSVVSWGEQSASHAMCFIAKESAPSAHSVGGWMGPTSSLDTSKEIKVLPVPGFEPQFVGIPAHHCTIWAILATNLHALGYNMCSYSGNGCLKMQIALKD